MIEFKQRAKALFTHYEAHVTQKNTPQLLSNGIFERWHNPVVTHEHAPVHWRYDLNPATNPYLLERLGVNATFNAGAMLLNGKYCVMLRVEGADRKSFFAVAESENGVDNFRFWDEPVVMPETDDPETNIYDMRLVSHEDGWIYGLFCAERKDKTQPNDISAADAQCGLARTQDLKKWERLPDLITYSGQQRNVVLHPEFIQGQYALYTRPQDGFIAVGSGGGIGWGLSPSMENAEIKKETIVDHKVYHSIKEVKNGQGPAPIKTEAGWLHLAHGVRNTAAGLRYVLYCFVTDINEPWRVTYAPGGYLLAPQGDERVGDVSNVVFSNGWIVNEQEEVFIYYASSDTRLHVATTSVARLMDYCINTPPDSLTSFEAVNQRLSLIAANKAFLAEYL